MKIRLVGITGIGKRTMRYYLLAEAHGDKLAYGLCVERCGETVVITDITVSRKNICRLLRMMIRGGVTPVTAMDVVEDWLGREFSA